jgi:hypothetical protein
MATMTEEQIQELLSTTYDPSASPEATQLEQQMAEIQTAMEASQPSFAEQYSGPIGEVVGSIVGGIYGAKKGAIPMPPAVGKFIPKPLQVGNAGVGAVIGAMAGRGTGEVIQDLAGDDVDVLESLMNVGEAGLFAYGGEKIFQLGGNVINSFYKARAGSALDVKDAANIRQLHQQFDDAGIMLSRDGKMIRVQQGAPVPEGAVPLRLTPGMLTNSKVAQTLEKVGRAGIGGGKIDDIYVALDDAMLEIYRGFENIARQGGAKMGREASGELFQNTVKQFEDEVTTWAKPKFANLDKLGSAERINMTEFFDTHRALLTKEGAVPLANKGRMSMLKELGGANNSMTFEQVFGLMQNMNNKIRDLRSAGKLSGGKQTELNSYELAVKELHDFVEMNAEGMGADLYDSYKAVSNTYKNVMTNTRSKAMQALVDVNPDMVGKEIARMSESAVEVKNIYRSLDETADIMKGLGKDFDVTAVKQQLQAGYVKGLMDDIVAKEGDAAVSKGAQFLRDLRNNTGGIQDTFNAMLPRDVRAALVKGLNMSTYLEKQAAGNFSLIVRGRQSGAAASLYRFSKAQTAGVMAGGAAAGGGEYFDNSPAAYGGATVALGFLLGPSFIARAAAKGAVGSRMLDEAAGIIKTVDMSKAESLGAATASALNLAAEAMTGAPVSELPPELQVEGARTAADALMYKALEQQAPQMRFPVTK